MSSENINFFVSEFGYSKNVEVENFRKRNHNSSRGRPKGTKDTKHRKQNPNSIKNLWYNKK